jgi:hypothetical protein
MKKKKPEEFKFGFSDHTALPVLDFDHSAAKYVLQGTKLLGDTSLPGVGPTTPEGVILVALRREAH